MEKFEEILQKLDEVSEVLREIQRMECFEDHTMIVKFFKARCSLSEARVDLISVFAWLHERNERIDRILDGV